MEDIFIGFVFISKIVKNQTQKKAAFGAAFNSIQKIN